MQKNIVVNGRYLNIPVVDGQQKKLLTINQILPENGSNHKVMEFLVPVADDEDTEMENRRYMTQIPVDLYKNSTLELTGDFSETFMNMISMSDVPNHVAETEKRPLSHFTADTGWTNDPNGMVYVNGVYHLYYQYNPVGLEWGNMSWGHAVSKDLLHWEQKDPVMFPDQDGMIYSGCAIKNDRELLGLPKDALIFFYTAAGGVDEWGKNQKFTQKMAYSLDGGDTLTKIDEPCVPFLYEDSRDPKVVWHEESQAYIMVLWTKGNDFGMLRSEDLVHWTLTDEVTLEDGWECPDLFQLKTEDGESCWFFWAAEGYYYVGSFDGYHFQTDGKKHYAYISTTPYAAQTFSGIEDRVISIPWMRIKNDGREFTSSYGIPMELFCKRTQNGWTLMQKPAEVCMAQTTEMVDGYIIDENNMLRLEETVQKAIAIKVELQDEANSFLWKINGSAIAYHAEEGKLMIDDQQYHLLPNQKHMLFLVDDRILEIFVEEEGQYGGFELQENIVSLELDLADIKSIHLYNF